MGKPTSLISGMNCSNEWIAEEGYSVQMSNYIKRLEILMELLLYRAHMSLLKLIAVT
jgi:hypothetical protein